MVDHFRTLRSSVAGNRPTGRLTGELYVNYPDMQLGIIDTSQNPLDLVAVRFFSTLANYAVGDHVLQGGFVYRAIAASSPGAFNATNWAKLGTAQDLAAYLPLAGGTLTGPLVLAADPSAALQPATKQYADKMVPLAGGTMTGALILSGPPIQNLQAATKAYVDGGAFLPLSGGTLTGPLILAGDATQPLGAATLEQVPVASTTTPAMDGAAAVGVGATFARADHVHPVDTSRAAASSLANYLPLAGGTLTGALTGTSLTLSGTINTPGQINGGTLASTTGSLYISATPTASGFYMVGSSTSRNLYWSAASYYSSFVMASAIMYLMQNTVGACYVDANANLYLNAGHGYQPGGGSWLAASDERLKKNVKSYGRGLKDVLRLEPIAFQYNGKGGLKDDGRTYHGLSAQALQKIMPELVIEQDDFERRKTPRPDGKGTIERPDDMLPGQLATQLGPLTLALVNAVKELTARLEALEGRAAEHQNG